MRVDNSTTAVASYLDKFKIMALNWYLSRLSIVINVQELERELLSASKNGDLDTVRRLSGEVAVSNVWDSDGWSPLHHAARLVDNIAEIQNCQ